MYQAVSTAWSNGYQLKPELHESANYKHWVSTKDVKRCLECEKNHGKIWPIEEEPTPKPSIHLNDRCYIEPMKAVRAGTATIMAWMGRIIH